MGAADAAGTPRGPWQDTVLLDESWRAGGGGAGHRDVPAGSADDGVLELRFTGSGSEYFRIWIVNLLLTLLTLGLYFPWAKARRLRYFHGNTLVGGHPLGFHGSPRTMLRGTVLVAVLLGLYSAAGRASPAAGGFAVLVLALLWPALIKSSLQFRLANTSWRGLRLRFHGTTAGAYVALLPAVLPLALFLAIGAGVGDKPSSRAVGIAALVTMLAAITTAPWLWFRLKRYQHDHYGFGSERTQLQCGAGRFYGLMLKTFGIAVLATLAAGGVVLVASLLLGGAGALLSGGRGGAAAAGAMAAAIVLTWLAFVLGGIAVVRPYFTARQQNLVWSATASQNVGIDSRLRFRALSLLTLKNWLLMVLTLGLYWPFAAVAVYRLRIEAVALTLSIDPDQLADTARRHDGEAAGDAAGDLFGLDVGY